jgi:hypothetical protein
VIYLSRWSAFTLVLASGVLEAQPVEESMKRNARLTVSAFQCAVVAPDSKERERLFNMGLKAGRDFASRARDRGDLYERVRNDIPWLWTAVEGPSVDFIVGRIYEQLEAGIYKEYDSDKTRWDMIKGNHYRQRNCALIQ